MFRARLTTHNLLDRKYEMPREVRYCINFMSDVCNRTVVTLVVVVTGARGAPVTGTHKDED